MNSSAEGVLGEEADSFSRRRPPIEVLVGPQRFTVVMARIFGAFGLATTAASLLAWMFDHVPIPGLHPNVIVGTLLVGFAVSAVLVIRPTWLKRGAILPLVSISALLVVVLVYYAGPGLSVGIVPLALGISFSPMWFGRRRAVVPVGILALGYALILTTRGYPSPVTRWLVVISSSLAAGALLQWLINRLRVLAVQERKTHSLLEAAHQELADLNRSLKAKVEAQVAEIEALNRLRRFLSPQVAEAVIAEGKTSLLQPHRRQIAVFFCDLRGFTSFASGAEAEEVVEALDQYYQVVGTVLHRFGATVGTLAGDGIMAYLNDPVPCDDPARTVVEMALSLRDPMAPFLATWKRRGYELGYGVGIAYGYATLGTVGFEGRSDYTALGSVVNLASRLCGEAATGQVLIDSRTADSLPDSFELSECEVALKGFAAPVRAHEVVG